MTRLILYFFSFLIPLNGIVSGIIGFKIAPMFGLLLLITRLLYTSKITFSKFFFIVFFSFILILLIQAFREFNTLILAISFAYYLLIGLIFSTYTNKHNLDLFYKGFLHGVILACLIFLISLNNGGVSNSIIEWQLGLPVNLSGMQNPNGWAPFLILAIAANDYIYLGSKNSNRYINIHSISQILILVALFFTYSRAALLCVIAYYLIIYFKKILKRPLIVSFVIIIAFFGMASFNSFNSIDQEVGSVISNKEGSINIRADVIRAVYYLPWDNILFGNGYGSSQTLIKEKTGYPVSLHNVYLAILVELGVIQFLLLLIICAYPFKTVIQQKRNLSFSQSRYKYILIGIFASLLYWMFHESHINTAFWAFYFCLSQQIRHLVKAYNKEYENP